MNELIFELIIQAKREFDEHIAECEQLGKQIEWVTEERLVELVVRECAAFIAETATIETLLGDRLKNHFGVKE